jgi:urocanate hydratase
MGYSLHSGMVVVADGTPQAAQRLERVLSFDPAMGIFRHADAGYDISRKIASERMSNAKVTPTHPHFYPRYK